MIYIFLHLYNSQICENSNNNIMRQLSQKTPINSLEEESISLPPSNLLQTLYSDSPSNNYYYTTLYIGKNRVRQTYLVDTEVETVSSPCAPCQYCGQKKTNYFFYPQNEQEIDKKIKCGDGICKLLPAI